MEASNPSATPQPPSSEQDDLIPHEPFPKSQEERIFDELKKNPSFNQYRYALLAIVAFGGGSMFGVAYLMFTKVLSLMDLVFAMAVFVWATVFVMKRLNMMKAEVVEQLKREDEEKKRKEEEEARRIDYEQALAEYYRQKEASENTATDSDATTTKPSE